MTAPRAADLLHAVGLLADGPLPWGRTARSAKPGVYLVELPAPVEHPPLDLALVGKWLERAPDLLLDGTRPSSRTLLARVARDWLPGQTVLFVGSTDGSLAERVAAVQATRPGDPLPCPAGLRLHLLRGIERCTTWWASTDAPEEYEDALLEAFAAGVDPAAATSLGSYVVPFAVLRRPTGEERPTGITGPLAAAPPLPVAAPTRVVDLPPAESTRQLAAPRPRAVAAQGSRSSAPATRRPTAGMPPPAADPEAVDAPGVGSVPASAGAPGGGSGDDVHHLSPEGLVRLEAELHELRVIRRPEVVRRVATAREHGDLKENAEYHAAREELGFLDGRANAIAARLRSAIVVDAPEQGERASIGSTLVVASDGVEHTIRLVGTSEADVAAGRISVASPVGKALVGVAAGDEVTVKTPAGPVGYVVLRVE